MSATDEAIDSMIRFMTDTGCYSPVTIRTYDTGARRVMDLIHEHISEDVAPADITPQILTDFDRWLKVSGFAPSTQVVYLAHLKAVCDYSGNHVFKAVRLVRQADTRPNVDWLSLPDAQRLLESPMNPVEEMVVWLGLCHGLRRVEVMRLRLTDVDMRLGIITVTGKGRGGGKLRSVSVHPNFGRVFDRWMAYRAKIIADADTVSDALVVYRRGNEVRSYETSGIHWLIWKLSHRLGIEFSMHTLRRTFGRELWHCGVSMPTIATIMGHSSTDTTMRYLGVNLDDMAVAMSQLNLGKSEKK